jgi:hypothetical protein
MAKKQKNQEVNVSPQETPQPTELTNEEKELIQSALKLVIAKIRKRSLAITLVSLAKHVELLLPFSVDIEYIRAELAKSYRLITLHDRMGEDILKIEVVLLYSSIEELLEEFQKKRVDVIIKIVDTSLTSIADYKQ